MCSYKYIKTERLGDGTIARITLNRPEARNEYGYADEKSRRLLMNVRTSMQQITDVQLYFWNMAKVTIAQVHGYCFAGGVELAMMADMVVAAEDCKTGHSGVRGLGYPRKGAIWPLVIGIRKVKELSLSGDSISGTEAERIGMISYAYPADQLELRTIEFADRFANMTADHLALIKAACNRWYENMGIYSSLRSSTEMDAMGQSTAEAYLWQEKMQEAMAKGGGQNSSALAASLVRSCRFLPERTSLSTSTKAGVLVAGCRAGMAVHSILVAPRII